MTRLALAAFAVLAHLFLLTLPAPAALAFDAPAMEQQMMTSPSHCDHAMPAHAVPAKSRGENLCQFNCAAPSPGFPVVFQSHLRQWSPSRAVMPQPHRQPLTMIVAPDPRPPRDLLPSL